MRNLFLFIAVAVIGMASTCSRSGNEKLVGTWKITESYADIGNGTGTWSPVTEENYLTFGDDGSFKSTRPLQVDNYDRYKVIDAQTIQFYIAGKQDSVQRKVAFEDGKITLWLQCIEECKVRMERSAQ